MNSKLIKPKDGVLCVECGDKFRATYYDQNTCSCSCKLAHLEKIKKIQKKSTYKGKKKKCENCDKVFIMRGEGHRFCSPICGSSLRNVVFYSTHCRICKTTGLLENHHIIPLPKGKKVITLCRRCHMFIHNYMRIIKGMGYTIRKEV